MTEAESLLSAMAIGSSPPGRRGGPWDPNSQSGGAVLALLGHVLHDVPTLTPMSLARLTVDFVRPVR